MSEHRSAQWEALAERILACQRCPELVAGRTSVVVGDRPTRPRVALVGEAPGAAEDAVGRPFVGRAGQLLDELLAAAGLPRADVAVLNALKCRPPRNRAPRPAEVDRCRPWLDQQLTLLRPTLVVALGGTAVAWFLGKGTRIAEVRGRVHDVDGHRVLPTYHPSAALRFGPAGRPRQLLSADLALAAELAGA